jgi:peptidoglycan/xylan/chitin deacetylase (PgdA/CDA1 family)
MTLFERRQDLLRSLPERLPTYLRAGLDPRLELAELGEDERSDPFHFGLSLVRQILDCEGMELGCHTFSHYCCLERGQDAAQFEADLQAWAAAAQAFPGRPVSFVFPRNQFNPQYLGVCAAQGFRVFRGNQAPWMYRASGRERQSLCRRGLRLADSYLDLSGDHGFIPRPFLDSGMIDCPASSFLRPFDPRLSALEGPRLRRIEAAMAAAARKGKSYHLWWHPHNFGPHLQENLAGLEELLRFHVALRDRFGVVPMAMGDLCAPAEPRGPFSLGRDKKESVRIN